MDNKRDLTIKSGLKSINKGVFDPDSLYRLDWPNGRYVIFNQIIISDNFQLSSERRQMDGALNIEL